MNSYIEINPGLCIGCGTCQSACSNGHSGVGDQSEPRLTVVYGGDVTASITCHHCEDAPCLAVCPVNSISHLGDHIKVNEQTCIGCKLCACVCPYGAIHPSGTSIAGVAGVAHFTPNMPSDISSLLRWEIGEKIAAVKCDLCAYDDLGPRCVKACPTQALKLTHRGDEAASSPKDEQAV